MCTMWEPDKSVYIRVCMCGCVYVYLSRITHSFQTCLSSTLLCVRECVHVCTSECEIPLSVLKPSLAYCPLRETDREPERERERQATHATRYTLYTHTYTPTHQHLHPHGVGFSVCVPTCVRVSSF